MNKTYLITGVIFIFFLAGVIFFSGLLGVKTEKIEGVFSERYQELVLKTDLSEAERDELEMEYQAGIKKLEAIRAKRAE